MPLPKISVILPAYNLKDYIRVALDSVISQTMTAWECICVDDGSDDGTGEILDAYARSDERFRVVHQTNQGVSAARNAAIPLAKGEWICFLDGDDRFLRTHLEDSYGVLAGKENKNPTSLDDWLKNGIEDGHVHRLFVRNREPFNQHRFPVGLAMREDTVYVLGFLRDMDGVVMMDGRSYVYQAREGSAISSVSPARDTVRLQRALQSDWADHPLAVKVLDTVYSSHAFYVRMALTLSLKLNSYLPAMLVDKLLKFQYAIKHLSPFSRLQKNVKR